MPSAGLLPTIPLWGIFCITLLLVLSAVEGGYQWARRKHRSDVEKEPPVGAMVQAALALLAFLLAFMFSLALDRYHDRQVALVNEVNAVQTVFLQADVIPEPQRTAVRRI